MALVLKDRVKETSTTVGTGTFTLAGAAAGYSSFASIGNGNTTFYTIADQVGNNWEVGIGTYTASGTTLSRDTVLANSAGTTAKITFTAGIKDVFCTYPAEKSVNLDASDNVSALGTISSATWNGTAVGIAYGGTGQTTQISAFNALSPITSIGDLILGNGTNSATRLAIGTNAYVLTSNGTTASWAAIPSSMVYPGAGIPNSTGSAWGTSYSTTGSGTVVVLSTSPSFSTSLSIAGTGYSPNINLTDAATIAWDTSTGQVATFTFVSNNRAMGTPTNLVNGAFYALAIIQSSGSNTITSWPSVWKWPGAVAPTLSTAAGAKDYFVFRSDGTYLYLQGQSMAVA